MANSFFVTLPSTTPGFKENTVNRYRVKLPTPLNLEGKWLVGLHSIVYPYSWDVLGAIDEQFIDIHLRNEEIIRASVPRATYHTPEALAHGLRANLIEEARKGPTRKRRAIIRDEQTNDEENSALNKKVQTSVEDDSELSYTLSIDPPGKHRRLDCLKLFSTVLHLKLQRVAKDDPSEEHTRDPYM